MYIPFSAIAGHFVAQRGACGGVLLDEARSGVADGIDYGRKHSLPPVFCLQPGAVSEGGNPRLVHCGAGYIAFVFYVAYFAVCLPGILYS